MSEKLDRFVNLLHTIFELDKSDLDFGIYRIMNIRKAAIEDFLTGKLPKLVTEILVPYADDKKPLITRKKEIEKACEEFGAPVEKSKMADEYTAIKQKLASGSDLASLEDAVYSHLYNFFNRYYEEGDFISKRRYKEGVYAIPYGGEEVKLYWANQDQYYIKTSENFKDYSFKTDGKTIHFRLVEATQEQNNNKETDDTKRVFMLYKENKEQPEIKTIEATADEMVIRFIYDVCGDANKKQGKWTEENFNAIKEKITHDFITWTPLVQVMEKQLAAYVAKNTFDYFIHKDLKGFFTRELDFYIKNEIIRLDDIATANETNVEQWFSQVKAVKQVGIELIKFLAQIENFQKKLWLKKKFIVRTDWCITLDRTPEIFYEEIRNNKAQVLEWITLYAIDEIIKNGELELSAKWTNPPSIDFLNAHKNLVLDTKHFSQEFKEKLVASIDNLDEETNGILIHSENFQALNLLQERYKAAIRLIYIDPPYNAKSSEILYKNNYKHSSWMSLIYDRFQNSRNLLSSLFVYIIAIDEIENFRLGMMLNGIAPECEDACISIQHNPTGQQGDNFSFTHDFAHFIYPKNEDCIGLENRNDPARETEPDIRPLRNVSSGVNHFRSSAANCFYPILVKNGEIIGFGDVSDDSFHPKGINEIMNNDIVAVYPIDPSNNESKWVFARDTVESIFNELEAIYDKKKKVWDIIRTKSLIRFKSLWADKRYSANSWGSVILNTMFTNIPFQFPKSIYTVMDCIDAGLKNSTTGIIFDYFAGSGTTGHAVINLNRADEGSRKYILVEMGNYFNTVTKPRMQKVIYANEWKNGKPTNRNSGVSQIMKYFRMESYEDTLNNIVFSNESLRFDDYLINYMLDIETQDSLLNLEQFQTPFDYKLKITENNETREQNIDLVETFNYLIGISVKRFRFAPGFKSVEGSLPSGKNAVIIWRSITENKNADDVKLETYFDDLRKEIDFSKINEVYINGDNTIANKKEANEIFDVHFIESTFRDRMFKE